MGEINDRKDTEIVQTKKETTSTDKKSLIEAEIAFRIQIACYKIGNIDLVMLVQSSEHCPVKFT